jgi:hypothetical protein
MLAQPPITLLIALLASESSESGWWISDMRPIDENPSARMNRLIPTEVFWNAWDVFIVVLDGFFASGFGRFIGRLTVRYRVQMIFGTPVSGFWGKSEEIIWKKVLAGSRLPRDRRAFSKSINCAALSWNRDAWCPGARPETRCVPLPFTAGLSRRIGSVIVSEKQKSQCGLV